MIGAVVRADCNTIGAGRGADIHNLACCEQGVTAVAGVSGAVSGKSPADLQIQSRGQTLRKLLHRIGGEIGPVYVHIGEVAASLVGLNTADEVHAGNEGAHQQSDKEKSD